MQQLTRPSTLTASAAPEVEGVADADAAPPPPALLAATEPVTDAEAVAVEVRVASLERDGEELGVAVEDCDAPLDIEAVALRVEEALGGGAPLVLADGVLEAEAPRDILALCDGVSLAVRELVGVELGLLLPVAELVRLPDGVEVAVLDTLLVPELVALRLAVADSLLLRVMLPVAELETELVAVALRVLVAEMGVVVGLLVGVLVGEGTMCCTSSA